MNDSVCAAIAACSDALAAERKGEIERLCAILKKHDINAELSRYMFSRLPPFLKDAGAAEKANALSSFFADEAISEIFDVSGGDLSAEVIPHLDFEAIASSKARLWGYSDLTAVINAVFTETGKRSVLYQVRNILHGGEEVFADAVRGEGSGLFCPPVEFLSGSEMSGVLVGGNIRYFLKLAGTRFFPKLDGKLLLLESLGGGVGRIYACLAHLEMLGAFRSVSGVIFGTFTELERELDRDEAVRFLASRVKGFAPDLPVARTDRIGHAKDSLAAVIGANYTLSADSKKMLLEV